MIYVVFVISASSLRWCGMTVLSNETEQLNSLTEKSDSLRAADEMQAGSLAPSRLSLGIYRRLISFAVFCMSTSATAVLIFLLLFWYYGGVCLLTALLIAILGKWHYWIVAAVVDDIYSHVCWVLLHLNHVIDSN